MLLRIFSNTFLSYFREHPECFVIIMTAYIGITLKRTLSVQKISDVHLQWNPDNSNFQ